MSIKLYHGLALWRLSPEGLYDQVAIGDIGYISEGASIRMFNVWGRRVE
jgi:hypothetical protein